jgi:hypothetical protein
MKIVPFIPEHAADIIHNKKLSLGTLYPKHEWKDHMQKAAHFDGWTGLDNGHIVGCAGIIPLWEGVGEAWFIGADRIQKHTLSAVRFVKQVFKDKQDNGDYIRLHANVRADWPEAIKFAKLVGFHKEGYMKKFGPDGLDYLVMGRIKT